ncbi:hypothetical protein DFS34DRAFT_417441 [Phlyctochytrium arcticum]|nr:hypothetical protein DFS34DRAFT_417441 [Phlyctochytrium arcticum]
MRRPLYLLYRVTTAVCRSEGHPESARTNRTTQFCQICGRPAGEPSWAWLTASSSSRQPSKSMLMTPAVPSAKGFGAVSKTFEFWSSLGRVASLLQPMDKTIRQSEGVRNHFGHVFADWVTDYVRYGAADSCNRRHVPQTKQIPTEQLIPAADAMFLKLNKYLRKALQKPVNSHATILDPVALTGFERFDGSTCAAMRTYCPQPGPQVLGRYASWKVPDTFSPTGTHIHPGQPRRPPESSNMGAQG